VNIKPTSYIHPLPVNSPVLENFQNIASKYLQSRDFTDTPSPQCKTELCHTSVILRRRTNASLGVACCKKEYNTAVSKEVVFWLEGVDSFVVKCGNFLSTPSRSVRLTQPPIKYVYTQNLIGAKEIN
jgi:hypothetical protein